MRVEKDTLGEVQVPDDALYGAQTQRAVENYPVSGLRAHPHFIRAFLLIKRSAATANRELGALDEPRANAIIAACDRILVDFDAHRRHFVVDVFQAGAGTSFNMNGNEVIANLANLSLGGRLGEYDPVHPNDHVNMAQSTNDVFPTALRIATLMLLAQLTPELQRLVEALDQKGAEFADVIKSGRTHLADAVPVTLGQEFRAYAAAMRRSTRLLEDAAGELHILGIGGTAAGTGLNAPRGYRVAVIRHLRDATGLDLRSSDDLREAMQSQLPVVAV
ncbi:MAG TPA: lyase family protein, partial [Thermoanaerobaculia bacterium]|nr:lyase family protein [Thermoanaerobaculia bacterium]